jgi:hypothetical protein
LTPYFSSTSSSTVVGVVKMPDARLSEGLHQGPVLELRDHLRADPDALEPELQGAAQRTAGGGHEHRSAVEGGREVRTVALRQGWGGEKADPGLAKGWL